MKVEIKKLTPERVEDYVQFFDTVPHNPSGNGDKCYCVTFCKDAVYQSGGLYWYPTAEERRQHGMKRVMDGDIQGYLAYVDGEVVGWCNAGDKADYGECIDHVRTYGNVPVEKSQPGEKIKFIFCFAVAPSVQRRGVVTQLINFVCEDARAAGFECVEAHTYRDFTRDGFKGTLGMYEKCGFTVYVEEGDNVVVRRGFE